MKRAPETSGGSSSGISGGVRSHEDLSGRDKLLANVLSGWIAQGVQLVSGFILPRLINDSLGQAQLGVWDFGWATVSYFSLLHGGVVSSVNRYVAQLRAAGDIDGLNVAVSSVSIVLRCIAGVIAVSTVAAAWFVPRLLSASMAGLTNEAGWVILFLGLTIAVQVQGAVYGGVLTGCHRWRLQNGIKVAAAMLSMVVGIAVIADNRGIGSLAAVMLLSEMVIRSAQRWAAYRVCPELRLSRAFWSRAKALEMIRFGGKGYVNVVAQMLVNQTTSILVVSTFGVAALALLSRPRSLVRSLGTVIHNNAMVVVPMVGAMQAAGHSDEIRRLAVEASRYAAFVCLPLIVLLSTLGSEIVRLWMGDAYADQVLIALFALSGLMEAAAYPLFRVLMGLNKHGRLASMNLTGAVVTVLALSVALLLFHADIRWVAALVAIPSLVINGILLPHCAAIELKMPFRQLIFEVWSKPVLCCVPAATCLFLVLFIVPEPGLERLSIAGVAAFLSSGWLYWRYAVPMSIKHMVSQLG